MIPVIGRATGLGLVAFGCLLLLGAVAVHQALALPLSELRGRPGILSGAAATLAGVVLVALGRWGRFLR